MLATPPLSLYIHIPWCVRKCPYCDFNSHESPVDIPEAAYIDVLLDDFNRDYSNCDSREIVSIFIGGGTPSLFSASGFDRILSHLRRHANLAEDIEVTMEANPGTAEAEKFSGFRSAGINRLSLGIQSFNDKSLTLLGRIHDGKQSRLAIETTLGAGFDNFNLDLMHGLPNQTQSNALDDLTTAISYQPTHLSWYQLTIEPNTSFYRRPPTLPLEDVLRGIQLSGEDLLSQRGFGQYEISAFATENNQSKHNLNYWKFGDYIGIGAGAHGKISFPALNTITRTRKHKQPNHYIKNTTDHTAERLVVGEEDKVLEFMMNALRLKEGFSVSEFENYSGQAFSAIAKQVDSLSQAGLLDQQHKQIRATTKGYHFLNNLLEEFL